mgnify:CR=1 FL=1
MTVYAFCGTYILIMNYERLKYNHGIGRLSRNSKDIARAVLMEPDRSYAEIGNRFGVSRQRVGQIARRLDITRRVSISENVSFV